MKWLLTVLFLFTCCLQLRAQQKDEQPKAKFITQFGFEQLTGGVILLHARFGDLPDTLNFILDTGSGAISLDSTTAEEFKIKNIPSGRTVSGIAGVREVNFAPNNKLHLPGLTVDSLDFYINNYNILSSVYGIKVDGVIGYSLLKRYIVSINYDERIIKIYTPGKFKYKRNSVLLKPLFTALPIMPIHIEDEKKLLANFYFDSGAGLCFLLTEQFTNDSSFLKKRKPVIIQVQGFGGKKQMKLTVIDKLKLGPFKFKNIPTNLLDDDHNALSYPFIGGLIGNDILRRFNTVLNYPEKTIALKANSHYKDPFDYSYTGMNMYQEDGQIIIDDIVPGSPAGKSGLKNGDVVIGINTNFSNNILAYKNIVQNAGKKVQVYVSRNEELQVFEFVVDSIF